MPDEPLLDPWARYYLEKKPSVEEPGVLPATNRFVAQVMETIKKEAAAYGPPYGEPLALASKPRAKAPVPGFEELGGDKELGEAIGYYFADIGVDPQPKFLKILEGVAIGPEEEISHMGHYYPVGEYVSRYWPGKVGYEEAEIRLGQKHEVGGWPGPDYPPRYRESVGFVFLHEALHRLDDTLSDKKWQEVVDIALEHYRKTEPLRARWMEFALAGEYSEIPPGEVFPRFMMHFLSDPEQWPEMKKALADYFEFK